MTKKIKSDNSIYYIIAITTLTLIITLFIFNFKYPCGCEVISSAVLGQFGDFYGGVLGTLVTFIGIYFIYSTFKLQGAQLDIAKKDADLEIMNKLYSELLLDINSIEYRDRNHLDISKPDIVFHGIDALYNFGDNYERNPNSVLNHLNSILISFDHLFTMAKQVRYKHQDMKKIIFTKIYFLYYSKIIWPVFHQIYQKHKEKLLETKQPNAKAIFDNYERLTKETYTYLLNGGYVEKPVEEKILAIIT